MASPAEADEPASMAQPAPATPWRGKPRLPKISAHAQKPWTARPATLSSSTVGVSPRPAKKLVAAAVASRAGAARHRKRK